MIVCRQKSWRKGFSSRWAVDGWGAASLSSQLHLQGVVFGLWPMVIRKLKPRAQSLFYEIFYSMSHSPPPKNVDQNHCNSFPKPGRILKCNFILFRLNSILELE